MKSTQSKNTGPQSAEERFRAILVDPVTGASILPAPRSEFTDVAPPGAGGFSPAQRLMETRFYSEGYERWFRPRLTSLVTPQSMAEAERLQLGMLGLGPRATVLDVACGTGNFTRAIAERLAPTRSLVVGIDLSAPMLAQAVAKAAELDHVRFVRGDAQQLPFSSAVFDAVHCAGAFHLMADAESALREMTRVVHVGGRVLIATFVRRRGWRGALEGRLGRSVGFEFFEVSALRRLFSVVGLEHEREVIDGAACIIVGRRPRQA